MEGVDAWNQGSLSWALWLLIFLLSLLDPLRYSP